MLFSPSVMGFFIDDDEAPADAIKVSAELEGFLRQAIIWGAEKFTFYDSYVSVTYPDYLNEYVTENNALTIYRLTEKRD